MSRVSTAASPRISPTSPTALDQRLVRFQDALDDRTKSINDGLSSRVMEIAKSVAGGGREIVAALDERVDAVTVAMSTRAADIADAACRQGRRTRPLLGAQTTQVAASFDQRIDRFEDLLTGRAESVISELEARGLDTANRLTAAMQEINTGASRPSSRSPRSPAASPTRSASPRPNSNARSRPRAPPREQSIGTLTSGASTSLRQTATEVERTIQSTAAQAEQSLTTMSNGCRTRIAPDRGRRRTHDPRLGSSQVEQSITSLSTSLSSTLKIAAAEVERTMTNVSTQVAHDFIGKADAIAGAIEQALGRTDPPA